ncbi:hypothetical protein Clacol_000729 [Clathrus columnatus]|uniref:NmrA-like domain-containing protein n=1 Tax=Clathrus columnatus TaxID=1419009 RepID=A0AAV4ZZF8_9AGAM|nr:hypothetical protein Clacol_000729 [Clathrus columnatus]
MTHRVFILGATGYIGGSVLVSILQAYPTWEITALVRSTSSVGPLKELGVHEVVIGTHEDLELIVNLTSLADVVINCADADDLPLTRAIVDGVKIRSKINASESKGKPILIHTSGTGVISDQAEGEFMESGKKIWNDNSEYDIRSIPAEQPHRLVDLEVFRADLSEYCSAYIIAPSTIYGTGTGPGNRISQQIPTAVRTAVKRSQAVHIADLTKLYLLVLSRALSRVSEPSSYAKFYFASVQEHVWGDVIRQIAQILYEIKRIPSPDVKSVSLREEPDLRYLANNSRSMSERGFSIGWKPHAPSIEETLEEDVVATLAKA